MNKRILICVLTIIWSTTLIHAERVSVDRARKVAENVLSESNNNVSRSPGLNGTAKKISPVLTFTRYATDGSMQTPSVYTTEPTPLYYIFNNGDNEGFVIVSADDNVTPVLGYSDTGNFTNVGIPQNIDNWFNGYARDISVIIENKIEATEDIKAKWANYEAGTASGSTANEVLLKTVNWSQGEPYNNLCPLYQSERTPTGCVATSMAIIMKYH